ncbi:MAG TPA: aromatic hydrocarbon degradation protein [Gammaproteobacteria bacterium]|nr:aromatic hydrocarbon degradation protein [Gammaproteobacteria bacterium]
MNQSNAGILSLRLIGAGILTACSGSLLASGFALQEQSASQMGNAFAGGAAIANDASTVYFNPAGMTRLPTQLVVGAHFVSPSAKFSGSATDPAGLPTSGSNGGDAGQSGIVPNLYFSMPVGQGLFVGLGINAPFGLSTKYKAEWKGRYQAIESEVRTVNINPSIAFQVNERLSVGFGADFQYMDAKLTQAVDQGSLCLPTYQKLEAAGVPLPAPPATICAGLVPQGADAFAKVTGDNWAGGYNLGLLYQATDSTRIGFSFRSQIRQNLIGNAKFRNTVPQFTSINVFTNTNASAKVDLPQSASLSIYQDVNEHWSVMADATWTKWSNFDDLVIEYDSSQPDTAIDESWNDTMRYALGVDYRYNSSWTFRIGGAYDETPIPNARHRTARIPGENRKWVSVGFGYQATPNLGIDVGYSHLFVSDPKIQEDRPTTGTLTGEYDAEVDILSAQLVWNI